METELHLLKLQIYWRIIINMKNKRLIGIVILPVIIILVILVGIISMKKPELSHNNLIIYMNHTADISIRNYDKECIWTSDDTNICMVLNGHITPKNAGKTFIRCELESGEILSCEVEILESLSDIYREYAKKEVEWLESLQLSDGSFSCYEIEENMPVRINPYFSCYASIAIMRNDYKNVKSTQIEQFINWYFSHMNTSYDVKGSVGTIYDYEVYVEDGKVISESSKDTYDSADSYAALFLMLLQEYNNKYKSDEIIIDNKEKVDMLTDLLLVLQLDCYTESKRNSGTKYLMNNMEAYKGFQSALDIYLTIWPDDERINKLTKAISDFEDNFSKMWINDDYYYSVLDENNNSFYEDRMDWEELYVFAIPQLFPVMFDITKPEDDINQKVYNKFCECWNWQEMDFKNQSKANTTWSLIFYAAVKMNDYQSADSYLEYFRDNITDRGYPYYLSDSAWIVLGCEEAYQYFYDLESKYMLQH